MLKKYLLLLLPIACCFADNKWQDFENNIYVGGAFSINSAAANQFGTVSPNSGAMDIGATALFNNKIYLNFEGNGNFLSGGSFVGNWYNGSLKAGYSLQTSALNFIPYLAVGYGNTGAFYSTTGSANYGVGLLSEVMLTEDWLIYADVNYQLQSPSDSINSDFNTHVLNNFTSYSISGSPEVLSANVGVKYITDGGYYFNPFFKYNNYQQSFNQSGGSINYGTLNPYVNQYQLGINIGLVI
jgi:hypothetical protein